MPNTQRGLTYPASTAHTRMWEHIQALADTSETALDALDDVHVGTIWRGVDHNIATGTVTKYQLTTALDPTKHPLRGMTADVANAQLIVNKAGLYDITLRAAFAVNATGYRGFIIYRSTGGVAEIQASDYRSPAPSTSTICTLTAQAVPCKVGDLIYASLVHTAGVTLAANGANGNNTLTARYVGSPATV
jgi:hypothetical protein